MKILKGEKWKIATRNAPDLDIQVLQEVLTHEDDFFDAKIIAGRRGKLSGYDHAPDLAHDMAQATGGRMSDKKPEELKSRELRIISQNPSRNKEGAGFKMRVVQYYKGQTNVATKLETGEYFQGDDGPRFKAKGFTARDIEELLKIDATSPAGLRVIQTALALMKNPPAIPAEEEAPAADAFGQQPDPEVPFS